MFRFFSKKNGKWTEKERLENSDTKVTEAVKTPSNEDPEAAQIGTTIRVLWIPNTSSTYCWVQGEVTEASSLQRMFLGKTWVVGRCSQKFVVTASCLLFGLFLHH